MTRTAEHLIEPLILNRWSARAMSGEPLPAGTLEKLLEAARWAPSANNRQPWRFVYAHTGTPEFQAFFELLAEGNRPLCQRASAFVVLASRSVSEDGKPMGTHAFDAGAAWMAFALQGSALGLVVHAMAGFDFPAAAKLIALPPNHEVRCMIAVGLPGDINALPPQYQAREKPSDRNPVASFAFAGRFPESR
jgi:nitroreductase